MQILYKPLKCQERQDYLQLSSSKVSDKQMPRISRVSRSFQAVHFQPINDNFKCKFQEEYNYSSILDKMIYSIMTA